MTADLKKSTLPKVTEANKTLDVICLEQIHQRIGEVDTAWEVVGLFDQEPQLRIQYAGLYMLAKTRIRKNQQWFKTGRFLGRCTAKLIDVGVLCFKASIKFCGTTLRGGLADGIRSFKPRPTT